MGSTGFIIDNDGTIIREQEERRVVPNKKKKNKSPIGWILIFLIIAAAVLLLIFVLNNGESVQNTYEDFLGGQEAGSYQRSQETVGGSEQSVSNDLFPLSKTFISSGSNFRVDGAKEAYFSYNPFEHRGELRMRYDNNSLIKRYVYCTGWDKANQVLTFSAYDQSSGAYIGYLEGTFRKENGRYKYTAVFTNYKGARSAVYYMSEN